MKAIILNSFGGVDNFSFGDWPQSEPQSGQVRIRLKAAAFNPADYKLRHGGRGGTVPTVLGFDLAGIIDAKGDQVSEFSIGDEVYAYLGGPKSNGSYAEYACVSSKYVARKPSNLTFLQAAAVPLTGLTAYQCVMDKAKVQRGEAIFIAGGSGGVGSMAIRLAKYVGAYPILTTAGNDSEVEYLTQKLGIPSQHILRYPELSLQQLINGVLKTNGGKPVAAAFDFVGKEMKRLCFSILGFDGRVVSIVLEEENFPLNLVDRNNPLFPKSATFHFQFLGARASSGGEESWEVYQKELGMIRELIEEGHISPPEITVVGGLSVESVRRAHILLEQGQVQGKLVMSIGS